MAFKYCFILLALTPATPPLGAATQKPCPTEPVPDSAPTSMNQVLADSLFARSNYVSLLPERSDSQPRNVAIVAFSSTATHEERQMAVHTVCGKVFGGGAGFYLIQVQTDGTSAGLWRAIRRLRSQPGVAFADPSLPEVSPLRLR